MSDFALAELNASLPVPQDFSLALAIEADHDEACRVEAARPQPIFQPGLRASWRHGLLDVGAITTKELIECLVP